MTTVKVKFKRLSETAILPAKQTASASCADIHSDGDYVIHPGSSQIISTGWSVEFPAGYTMEVFSRSGHGVKRNVRLANCTGIIDPDYRGELMVALFNEGSIPFHVTRGDRIAQAFVVKLPDMAIEEVSELSKTERGAGGFGSTGS